MVAFVCAYNADPPEKIQELTQISELPSVTGPSAKIVVAKKHPGVWELMWGPTTDIYIAIDDPEHVITRLVSGFGHGEWTEFDIDAGRHTIYAFCLYSSREREWTGALSYTHTKQIKQVEADFVASETYRILVVNPARSSVGGIFEIMLVPTWPEAVELEPEQFVRPGESVKELPAYSRGRQEKFTR